MKECCNCGQTLVSWYNCYAKRVEEAEAKGRADALRAVRDWGFELPIDLDDELKAQEKK